MTDELAAELVGRHLMGADTEFVLDATQRERERIFNLGYFTWVEQQGIALADFDRRRGRTSGGPAGACAAVGRDDHGLQSRQRHAGRRMTMPRRSETNEQDDLW